MTKVLETNTDIEINQMIEKEAIIEVTKAQLLSQIFLREKKAVYFKPVFNLKKLNSFIVYQHFKMETRSDVNFVATKR